MVRPKPASDKRPPGERARAREVRHLQARRPGGEVGARHRDQDDQEAAGEVPRPLQRPAEQQQPGLQVRGAVAGRHMASLEEGKVVVPPQEQAHAGHAGAAPTLARGGILAFYRRHGGWRHQDRDREGGHGVEGQDGEKGQSKSAPHHYVIQLCCLPLPLPSSMTLMLQKLPVSVCCDFTS